MDDFINDRPRKEDVRTYRRRHRNPMVASVIQSLPVTKFGGGKRGDFLKCGIKR